ncbi:hypothetical protein Tco_0059346 [Tanacetum coccineum]
MSSTGPSLWLEVKNVWKVVSSISKKVTHDIQSSMLSIIDDNLKENLPSLLSEALKNTFPHMIIDSIKQSVSNTIEEKLPVFYAQDLRLMFKDMVLLLEAAEVFKKANAEREKGSKHQLKNKSPVNEENALILYTLVKKGSEENTSEKKVSDDEPLIKKLKFLIPTSSLILSPTPLKSIIPKPTQKPDATTMTIDQFTEHDYFIYLLTYSSKRANSSMIYDKDC